MAQATDNVKVALKAMKQSAVWWPKEGVSSFGKPTYGTPEEISCRWEVVRKEFIDPTGERQASNASLFVDRDVSVGDVLLLGSLSTSVDQTDPYANEGAWEIRMFSKMPDLKGRKFLREVML